jgi:hypothetical protein
MDSADEIDRENRRIALDHAVKVSTYGGEIGNEQLVERAEAYLTFLNGASS